MGKKILTSIFIFAQLISFADSSSDFIKSFDTFLKKYVSNELVDYSAIQQNKTELESLYSSIKKLNISSSDSITQKTLWINTYNFLAIYSITEKYPVNSPLDIAGFYDKRKFEINKEKLTLNDIENEKLRKQFSDPRIHFVLVCGAMGCPPIINFAYTPESLNQALELQAQKALNDENFIRVNDADKTVFLSEIFKWYSEDFNKKGQNTISFVNQYRDKKIPNDYTIDYYTYDWSVNAVKKNSDNKKENLQSYTPSVLLQKGQWEYKFFNNLYTQTQGYDSDGNKVKYNSRGTYFSSINQFLIGISPKLNIGFDAWIKSVRNDSVKSSPFALLKFENSPNTRTALSGVGPKIKIAPFKKLSHLSIQSTFLFPVAKDQEGVSNGKPYLSADSYIWFTQIFYDQSIGSKFQLFFQVAPWVYIKREKPLQGSRTSYSNPVDVFFSYFPTKRITFYYENEYWLSFGDNGISSYFRQEGIGLKVQAIKGLLEIETVYTKFSMGKNAGAGETYNLGFRIIH